MPVDGGGFEVTQLVQFLMPLLVLLFQFTVLCDCLRGRVGDEFPFVAIKDAGIECPQIEDRILQANYRWDPEGTSQNRGVRGDAALLGGKSHYLVAIHCGCS